MFFFNQNCKYNEMSEPDLFYLNIPFDTIKKSYLKRSIYLRLAILWLLLHKC